MTPGMEIDGFVLRSELGRGANGSVWAVEHASTRARYALKLLASSGSAQERERFRREVDALTRVDGHPNVVRVHTAGVWRGRPYVVMEQLAGGDLRARLKQGPLGIVEAAALVEGLARGLAHAHAQGVLHRDIKPANVLFDEAGVPKLADFGLAGSVSTHSLTQTGTLLGTPAYMPPEQVTGNVERIDQRSDVYALGAVLYETLTGEVPFPADDLTHLAVQIVNATPASACDLRPGLPPVLSRICMRALAKDPADRFPSAGALAAALAGFEEAAAQERRTRRRAAVLGLVGAGGVVALLGVGLRSTPAPVEQGVAPSARPSPPVARPSPHPPPRSPAPTPSSARPTATKPPDSRARLFEMLADTERARALAQQGDLAAMRHLASAAERRGDHRTALRYHEAAARAGSVPAMVKAAGILLGGRPGVSRDVERGLRWSREAAALGDQHSHERLVRAYAGEYGVRRDLARARRWLERMVALGTPHAQAEAGKLVLGLELDDRARGFELLEAGRSAGSGLASYELGKRALRRDPAAGRALLREAAGRGSRRAMERLALHLLARDPSPSDRAEALRLLRLAVRKDSVSAMATLGEVLKSSTLPEDREEGRRQLERAAKLGSERARALLQQRR